MTELILIVKIAAGVWIGNVLSFLFADWWEEWQLDKEIEEMCRGSKPPSPKKAGKK